MNHVLSVGEYLIHEDPKLKVLREALLSLPVYESVAPLSMQPFSLAPTSEDRLISHQVYLLDHFDTLDQINVNENLLLVHNYSPILLTELGTYEKTLEYLESLNESFLTKLKSVLSLMTEGGSVIGIFQFVLDLIGMIPASWFGFPVDILANGLNGIIYLVREQYLMAVINFIAMIDLTKVFAPLKLGIKTVAKPATKLFSKLFSKGFGKAEAAAFKASSEAAANPGIVKMLGQALGKLSKWLAETGIKMLKGIVPTIVKAVDKLTFGAFKLDKYIPKMTAAFDTQIAKLNTFAKEADDASRVLLSDATAKKAASTLGDASVAAKKAEKPLNIGAERAVRTGAEQSMYKAAKGGKIGGFSTDMLAKSEAKFNKLFPGVTNPAVKKNFIYNDATKQLVDNILSKQSGLLSITKNKKIMAALSTGKTWKGADRMLASAIKKGDPVELGNVMQKMLDDPEFFALIKKTSPDVVKTMSLFRNAPEALITGSKKFADFGKVAAKGAYTYRKFVLQQLPVFLLKVALKGTECGRYITRAKSAEEVTDLAKGAAIQTLTPDMAAVDEILSRVYEQTEEELLQLSQQELDNLRSENPQAYTEFVKTQTETDQKIEELKQKTDSANPCYEKTAITQAEVGAILDTNNKAWKQGQVAVDLTSPEEFDASNLNNYSKGVLSMLKQDTNIDAQHPLADQNPVVQAYFSDVVKSNGEISYNESDESRLEEMLNTLVKQGKMTLAEKEENRKKIMDAWNSNTVPPEVINAAEEAPNPNESVFKVGKFITVR
jgi:hypothetical protein